ncbi:MAG: tRNA ((37)-N6)-dimethylallyltransferase MiaA [Rickettsiales bacterium]|jgi:tRNA dimethylallyltransferase|nr:tRNA ((37)-N6)-dimethylallyltransferase MiaA [Rickettsiales bacterium]
MSKKPPPIVILGGPTASGKSSLGASLAKKTDAVIINADAMQVYAGIPIITAQPSAYEQQETPHALYGILPPEELCSVGRWLELAKAAIDAAHKAKRLPILVGGTGMYLYQLMHGLSSIPDITPDIREHARGLQREMGNAAFHEELKQRDPVMAERLPVGDTQRMIRAYEVILQTGESIAVWQEKPRHALYPPESFIPVFLHPERQQLYAQCDARFQKMLENGALEEVRALMALDLDPALPAVKALGVPELMAYLRGEYAQAEAIMNAQMGTRQYAKRQMTWFKNQMTEALEITTPDAEKIWERIVEY